MQKFLQTLIFILVCSSQVVSASPTVDSIQASKELLLNEPSCFVNHSVNVITGNYHENAIDIEVAGPHPLFYQRTYTSGQLSGNLCSCWNTNHYGEISVDTTRHLPNHRRHYITYVQGDGGGWITYEANVNKKHQTIVQSIEPTLSQKYLTHSPDFQGAGSHIKNNRLYFEKDNRKMILTTGDGYQRHFNQKTSKDYYNLIYEDQPTGCQIHYGLEDEGNGKFFQRIWLKNRAGEPLSFFDSHYSDHSKTILGNDGKWVKYRFKNYKDKEGRYLHAVEGSDIPYQTFEYDAVKFNKKPKLIRKTLPEGRYLCNEYYQRSSKNQNGNEVVSLAFGDPIIDRVMLQKAPVGVDATPIITNRYFYDLRHEYEEDSNWVFALGGRTTVYDAHNNKSDYFFNDDFRLTDIWKWGENNSHVYTIEQSFWGAINTPNASCLMSRTLANSQREVKLCRSYTYDQNGNIIQKYLWGNLTGQNAGNISLDPNGIPYPGSSECYTQTYTYVPGHPHLIYTENDGKKTIEYYYQAHTNLNTGRFVKVGDRIYKREYCAYDGSSCLQSVTVDDGFVFSEQDLSSVTERRITRICSTTSAPHGLPQIVDQFCVDLNTNQDVFLGRVLNTYSQKGKLISQKHYDSEAILKFTLEWEYDPMGNLIKEKDALGREIIRKYDQNRNLVYEEGPYPGIYKEMKYDFVNRLIGTTEVHPDGITLTYSFRYDFLGNKISSIDPYGQETRFVYDNQNRLIQTILPIVLDENGHNVQPTTKIEYDIFNNPCRLTDAVGGVTTIFYTAYNKPYLKIYPDGSAESFTYDITGNLVKSVAQNATKTIYQYDPFDRMIKKDVYSANDQFLHNESNVYNAFHLLSNTDAAGVITNYQYDRAGRLVAVTKGEMLSKFEYDTLGRESKTLVYYGKEDNEYTAKIKEYDLLNRIIEERMEDASGKVLTKEAYEYDILGNRNVICKYNQAGTSLTHTEYNTRGQIVSITNALGEQTRIHYRYDYYDEELGQNLPYSESTDPKGILTVCIKDALGRTKTEYKKDPFGKLLQKRRYFYTLAGLLGKTIDDVIVDGELQREVANVFKYNTAGKLLETIEAEGTPERKISKYLYNSFGQKQSEIKPDGTTLHYDYDPLGRLKEYYSSDESFHYIYEYDVSSNPICVFDRIHDTKTIKSYDQYNRLTKETLGNGLSIEYSYDLSGRPTQMIFPDQSGVGFGYESLFLKEVFRINQKGEKTYSHTYNSYDQSGNVLESTLIGKAGKTNYSIDLNGRLSSIVNDTWTGSTLHFDETGNVIKKTSQDHLGKYVSEFKYDDLSQLTEELGPHQQHYACDSLYNRIRKGRCDYTVNHLNQVTHDGKNHYHYDLNGNLIRLDKDDEVINLLYDALNRLIQVDKNHLKVTYRYDEMNRRISKTVSDVTSTKSYQYLYQELNEIGCYEEGIATELRLLGLGKGAEIGAAIAMEFNQTVYAPIHDFHGNVISLVEAETGNIKEFYRYSAFGEETLFDQQNTPTKEVINPWRFSSKRTDSETGFVYFGRRYYDSQLGRWITPDPIGFEGGPNLYAYVGNNPLTHIDLYGLYAKDLDATKGERSFFSHVKDFAVRAYDNIRECFSRMGSAIGEGLSRFSRNLAERFSSRREDRQIRFHSGMLASKMNQTPPMRCSIGEGEYVGTGFCNGINNTEIQAKSSGEMVSDMAGGKAISLIYNPTNGVLHDIFRAMHSLFFDFASNVVPELHKQWDAHFEKYGAGRRFLQLCHSEGTINIRNGLISYSPELRKMIDVVAIAPACYIDRNLCGSVNHYVSTRDFVPCFDIKGRIQNRETVHVLSPHKDAPLWDHDFQSPTYSKFIKGHIHEHLRQNGY